MVLGDFSSGHFRTLFYFGLHCAGYRADRCGHRGESPADQMAATVSIARDFRCP
ncbi:hypothetical protein AM571_CH00914 [Rhizobium etli 8C-3]|uniref:Uncharacterized protein n=1 Tax=Rhizobium etli 8C-3 TaxID=538025 RepID=A0A1L5P0V7_RHIET|nr:hypothetical protein AM571_CH00914 [Rhizobium etli 8C-3]